MSLKSFACLGAIAFLTLTSSAQTSSNLLPSGWNSKQAADKVMAGLVNTTAPQVKGAHDADFAMVGDRAFIVAEANDVKPGESAGWPFVYVTLSVVNCKTLAVEKNIAFARGEQAFENETLPAGACFVPRILQKDAKSLRCWFASLQPGKRQEQMWHIDFDIERMRFENRIHKTKLKTTAGTFDMQPQYFHADAAAHGFKRKPLDHGLYIFDSFKVFDGKIHAALNNFPGKQNALAVLNEAMDTFEIIGHYNRPQELPLSESAVNRLPDGTWMAICRQDGGTSNYTFTTSRDGKTWTPGEYRDFVPNGTNSKPTFDRFNGIYYLGWQEATKVDDAHRSVFNLDVSRDGKTWERKYRFESAKSFQYPSFHEHHGAIWLTVTQGDTDPSRKERIMFGKLENLGGSEPQNIGEKLYNGITLPQIWPPPHLSASSIEPMPLPYLQHPPDVFPIDVGRQLFVDDFLIDRTDLKRTFHVARKFEGNPVFKPETKHELASSTLGEKGQEAVTYLGHGGVFYDPAVRQFKMFYTAGWRGSLALATSTDLRHWTRPNLGVLADNLLLAKGSAAGGDNSVWLDLGSENQRIKYLTDQGRAGHTLQTSADGRKWSAPVTTGSAADYCSIFHNPFRNVWCQSIKRGGPRGRSRWYHEDPDFLKSADWQAKSVYWCNADRLDEPDAAVGDKPQLYSLSAVAYESVMLGAFQILLGPDNKLCDAGKFPKITEIKLGFSRDGFHWHRPDRRAFIAATRKEGDWDRAYLHTTTGVCVVHEDQLVFPYCAYSGIAPNGTRGMYCGASVGLATLRRDGFASMDGAGTLMTRPVIFQGGHLFVNLVGELQVEVLDPAGKPLAVSKVVSGDHTKVEVQLPGLSAFAGKPVRFRFRLASGSLYAFWVTSDARGASNGYVGAGGPAFPGVRDLPNGKP